MTIALTHRFTELQTLLLELDEVSGCLHVLAVSAAELAPGVSCGITIRSDTGYWTAASTDGWVELLDAAQHAADGPGSEALRSGTAVLSPDVSSETRWSGFTDAARRQGVRAALSLPVGIPDLTLASLNLYSFGSVDVFAPANAHHYRALAAQVGLVLGLVARTPEHGSYLSRLADELPARTIINQAVGIIMGRDGLAPPEALDVLREEALGHHQQLHERAGSLVAQVSGTAWWPVGVTTPS